MQNFISQYLQSFTNSELSNWKAPIERKLNISRKTLNNYLYRKPQKMPELLSAIVAEKMNIDKNTFKTKLGL
jgi:hypothetical protein